MKSTLKRFLSLVLCMCMVMALLPNVTMTAFAATSGTVTGLADENIGLTFTGDADDAWSANGTSITGAAISVSGGCRTTSYKSTLTITNKKSTTATLSFDYTIEQNSGTIQVDGTEVSSGASFTKELAANESVKVYIQSGSTDAATKITLTNVVLVSDVNATATFVPAENGTYTVDGKLVTEEYSNTQSSMTAYQVVATPADGYQFMGWYDVSNEKYISTSAKAALNIENDCTITARFASKTAALFETGGQRFDDLGDAVSYAQANSQSKITLATNGSISGTYTIPTGITLLIPFDEAGTLYTDAPAAIRTTPESKPFRTLTMSKGTSITVNGAISLGGRYFAAGGGQQGRPIGDYGYIKMADNSSITVKNGGNLYAWGFISGSGSVLAESGATVYEFYQIADFRGGTASSGMHHGVFPFSQYFVQNIEVPLTLNAGANEQVYSGVYAMKSTYTTAINFIGDTGMFKVESGSFTKDYDEKTDRLVFTVNGEAALNTLSLTLAGMDVNSESYVLPITNNITINIQSGNVTINQDAALLAGVEVNIAEGAGLTVANGKNIYFYDSDEWNSDNFVWGPCKFKSVAYAPGKAYNRSNNDLVDAKMDVNGSVTAIGAIYTTKGGANICSSNGTGKYIQQGTPGTETETYQYNADSNAVTIPITAAKLHNADDSYTGTAGSKAGDTYVYANGKWALRGNEIAITFDPNGGAGSMEPMSVNPGVGNKLTGNTFTRENYTFTGWNTAKDGTGKTYADGEIVNFSADTTLYAQWTQNPVITFDANGGKGTMGTQTVKPNEATDLTANSFTRADYDFTGWNTAKDGTGTAYADKTNITTNENVTLYAQWTLHKYHVRWLNWDDTVLQDGYYTCEEEAKWDDWNNDPPSRPEDENYTYVFAGRWTPYDETKGINGWGFNPHEDVDFKAVFNEFKKLTVTFDANGGIGTMDSVKIANGGSGKYYMLPECGFTREGYTFNGWLITGTVKMSVWDDDEEKLNDEPWTEPELLALSDLTLKASWKHSDGWFTDVNGKQYYKDGELQKTGWTVIDGNTYYLDTETGYAATGITTLVPDGATEEARCVFDAEGVFQSDVTGVYSVGADTYWLNSGIIEEEAGLKRVVKENGEVNYYYFAVAYNLEEQDWLVLSAAVNADNLHGEKCWLHKTNNLLPAWFYEFNENGVIPHENTKINGIQNVGGTLYYYIDGIKAPAGMIQIDNDIYYVNSKAQLVCGQDYYCSRTNDLKEPGYYTFDADGKMVRPSLNGIVQDDDGVLRYYVNGKVTYVGLIEINGDYYYVRSNGEVVTNCTYYITWTHDLKEPGYYVFDAKGKLIGVPKNGIIEEDGTLRYYANGEPTYVGLIKIGRDYYYVNSKCEVVHSCTYYVSWTHGLIPEGKYTFDAKGRMIDPPAPEDPTKSGIVEENGALYYYESGVKVYAGLIQIDGDYYYVNSSCKVVTTKHYWVNRPNDLLPAGFYDFGEDGKMTNPPKPVDHTKNGFVTENGAMYYYVDGVKTYAGLIQIDGDYYYVNSSCKVVTTSHYWVNRPNDLLPAGFYNFGADGKMIET